MDKELRRLAIRALSRREYSRSELAQKLEHHKTAPHKEEIHKVLDDLEARDLLSDQRFSQALLRHKSDAYGDFYLKQLLAQKGVEDMPELWQEIASEDVRVNALLGKPAWQSLSPEKCKQRLFRRGFSADTIYRALRS